MLYQFPVGGGGGGGGGGLPPVSPPVSSVLLDVIVICTSLQLSWSSTVWNGLGHSNDPNHMISSIIFK